MNKNGQHYYSRLLLTGAAGKLGRIMRPRIKPYCKNLRISDIINIDDTNCNEEFINVDLKNSNDVDKLLEGVDCVVHFGGISTEHPFDEILQANIIGIYNLYEAARKNGTRRIIFASSNHVTGFYKTDNIITPEDPFRPDSLYGVSKAYGENLARLYYDKYGIETACLRIGSCCEIPIDERMLHTWLSYDDLERLIVACLTSDIVNFTVIYGVSNNDIVWWNNGSVNHINFQPKDSSSIFINMVKSYDKITDINNLATIYQGGNFVINKPI